MSEHVNDVTPMPSSGPIIRAKEPSAYTPSTDYVRENFFPVPFDLNTLGDVYSDDEYCEESAKAFDRWLAEHDHEITARAWWLGREAGVKWAQGKADEPIANPYESEEK